MSSQARRFPVTWCPWLTNKTDMVAGIFQLMSNQWIFLRECSVKQTCFTDLPNLSTSQ